MDLDTKCIPLGHIQTYFNLKKSIEVDADWLMKRTGITPENPDELMQAITGLEPSAMYARAGVDLGDEDGVGMFVSSRQVLNLVGQIIEALDMPYIGLPMGNLMTVSHHGMAGLAAVTQPTLWDCGQAVVRYCRELFPPLEMSITLDGDEGWFSIEENTSLAPYTHFFVELNMVSFYNIFRDLVANDPELMPVRVELGYPEPAWGHIYRRYFKCPVVFGCHQSRIIGKASLAEYELPLANRLMAMTAEKSLFENIPTRAMKYLPLRLRRLLIRYYGAFPSLENAASELGMSGRTMRRKLKDDGTSYQQELDFVRQKFAREYFARGGDSITELAHLLGFADSSAFAKAFRRWTDMSPKEYMASIQART
ncbi:MAG: AraC family transcriptional regulator [Oceanospirillaceae bacterium]|jgi:AraC-like DNA-binding protein|uniref:AraC family transcriptional regulator n=1 Tax=unclassified Thalassolituus TaxID=2624967 RepID=UPI000C10167B|nr:MULTISPECIES: AraC family transcriptional regulator [unclassified Thalassolituus]MAE35107.1 AraC family transcriptional regulator [Oceanospirillaceae bacterium]MBN59532.1 AraC family transcriptional regulator [Oceanospirillaceae bacterium]MDQ4424077.1 AraC family transcriptional regulator [Thalassolituus sp.]MDQ4427202.1 AraC family transcriptional regulator [Thalassolituus sp.]|tara:strand:- start:6878 stop:7978 length:1101 start_codon:yes stop_codon:yes gene_type:complete